MTDDEPTILLSDFNLDDLPEDTRYPEIVFGPEAVKQIREMEARPMPDWLKTVVLKHALNKATSLPCPCRARGAGRREGENGSGPDRNA